MGWNNAQYNQGVADAVQTSSIEVAIQEYKNLSDAAATGEYGLGYGHGIVKLHIAKGDLIGGAKFLLDADCVDTVMAKADRMVENDIATWILDPQVDNVVGLVDKRTTVVGKFNKAFIVVYLDDLDHETSNDFEEYGNTW